MSDTEIHSTVDTTTRTNMLSDSNNNSAGLPHGDISLEEKPLEDSSTDLSTDDEGSFGMTREDRRPLREIKRRASRLSQRRRTPYPDVIRGVPEEDSSTDSRECGGEGRERIDQFKSQRDEKLELLSYVEKNIIGSETSFDGPFGEKRGRFGLSRTTSVNMCIPYTPIPIQRLVSWPGKLLNSERKPGKTRSGEGTEYTLRDKVRPKGNLEVWGTQVVFVGPYEHHSNILPWKESGAQVERIKDTKSGHIDCEDLDKKLRKHKKKSRRLIGCFSAASNVTGIISDTHEVAAKLHEHGALSFWDYATAGPYLKIDMNPTSDNGENFSKDAVYLSPHKFVGILIAKKHVFLNEVPDAVGGGTVVYVTRETHHYSSDIEEREEGGTPAIVESIRAGLTFKLKDSIGADIIEEREEELTRTAFGRWKRNGNIIILGSSRASRLPIFSFLITHPPSGKVLHHDFVADLLGIDEDLAQKFVHFLVTDREKNETLKKKKRNKKQSNAEPGIERTVEIMKPGFVRLNLPFFFSEEAIDYILTAYQADPYSAKWTPVHSETLNEDNPDLTPKNDSLLAATFKGAKFTAPSSPFTQREASKKTYQEMLSDAERVIKEAKQQKLFSVEAMVDDVGSAVKDEELIWFLRPQEAAIHLRRKSKEGIDGTEVGMTSSATADPRAGARKVPFIPKRYTVLRKSFRNSFRRFARRSGNNRGQRMNERERDIADEDDMNTTEMSGRESRCIVM
ncbi:Cysteine desulfurase 1, chloroplastic [Holothuria leucospilota]|uniref:Cysteine desulfurase 1, chloroplastic n=1 Tax=Holothuria leucospilota TaxID=206669 RepID=A0A9Q1C129_HOLLE|nr:Cysteine desulfurase 1, chloroplastic [Holothuria leucospilota]